MTVQPYLCQSPTKGIVEQIAGSSLEIAGEIAGSSLDIVHYQTFGDTLALPLESQESNQGSNGGQTTVPC